MSLPKIISLAYILALVGATPVSYSPSKILPRDPPKASKYPLEDPCGNEWQYLNFNKDDDTDKSRLKKLHDTICSGEVRALASYGQASAQDNLKPYKRYFPQKLGDNPEDDIPARVAKVLGALAGDDSPGQMVGPIIADMIVDNKDFGDAEQNQANCKDGKTHGYTLKDDADGIKKIHFCDIAYDAPSEGDVDCSKLDPFPSTKMDSFSRIAIHEMTHIDAVGELIEDDIIDTINKDNELAYDPPRVHALVTEKPEMCDSNADSYAWLALDSHISRKCATDDTGNNWENYFTKDPPDY